MACLVVSLIMVSAATPGCKREIKREIEPSPVVAPKRPQGVPKYAVWTGGASGGVFVMVQPKARPEQDNYVVDVYDDHAGSRLFRGVLRMEPAKSGPFPVGHAESYSGWDGEALHLKDGRRLVKSSPSSSAESSTVVAPATAREPP